MMADTPEQLALKVEKLLAAEDYPATRTAVENVERQFAGNAAAHHLAGLVWERSYLEENAHGKNPPLEYYERAEHFYRRAMEFEEEAPDFHAARLYACLFVLGTQRNDVTKLEESLQLAIHLKDIVPGVQAAHYERESAVVAASIANLQPSEDHFQRAEELFALAEEPAGGREAFFFHYYRAMLMRAIGQERELEHYLREAIASFRKALALQERRPMEYLLADCLVQLQAPTPDELELMDELVPRLYDASSKDKLIESLHRRWQIRHKLLEKGVPEGENPQHDPGH